MGFTHSTCDQGGQYAEDLCGLQTNSEQGMSGRSYPLPKVEVMFAQLESQRFSKIDLWQPYAQTASE